MTEPTPTASPPAAPAAGARGEESTVGTGSVVAVGCTVASLVVILAGIGLFVLLRLL